MVKPGMLHRVPTTARVVTFTFDDGPHPVYTAQLMDIFRQVGGKATFYMIGQQIDAHPATAAAVHAAGHELGNHTWTHPRLTQLAPEAARAELVQTDERIQRITRAPVRTFRPPFLDVNDAILALAAELGYWSIGAVNLGTRDWEQPGVGHIVEQTRESVGSGSILVFHDGFGDRSQSVEAVRILVAELAAQDYRFVTVSELLALVGAGAEQPAD
ncbi:MAG: polysaccharide deacetylase family protein [Chloroflexota bacterium]|nr:polysaccharide deacetylase family protein [Chloroflexota bacterium]